MSDTDTGSALEAFVDDSEPDEVAKAKEIGWKAPSDWKGNAPKSGKFLKAKEYLERAETVIPIMKSENKKLKDELSEARAELKDFRTTTAKTIDNMSRMTKVALDRQREQLEDKWGNLIDAATEVGDKAEVRKLRQAERDDLKKFDAAAEESRPDKETVDAAKEKVNAALPKDVQEDIADWLSVNDWYHKDEDMQAIANRHDAILTRDKPKLTTSERLEEVRKYIVKKFPKEFPEEAGDDDDEPDERPARGSRVEGGSRMAGGSRGSKWSSIPADAKEQGTRFIMEERLFLEKGETAEKDLAKARERYAVKYLES